VVSAIVAGGGERLFGETGSSTSLRFLGTQPIGDSLVLLSYERATDG
jgi:hypothetical protein